VFGGYGLGDLLLVAGLLGGEGHFESEHTSEFDGGVDHDLVEVLEGAASEATVDDGDLVDAQVEPHALLEDRVGQTEVQGVADHLASALGEQDPAAGLASVGEDQFELEVGELRDFALEIEELLDDA